MSPPPYMNRSLCSASFFFSDDRHCVFSIWSVSNIRQRKSTNASNGPSQCSRYQRYGDKPSSTCAVLLITVINCQWISNGISWVSLSLFRIKGENFCHICSKFEVHILFFVIYTAPQKHESTLLHTYVLNAFLTGDC